MGWQRVKRNLALNAMFGTVFLAILLLCFLIPWLKYQKEKDKLEAAKNEIRKEKDAKELALAEKKETLKRAEGIRLAYHSSAVLPTDPGLALLLGIESAKLNPGRYANNALIKALKECRERKTLFFEGKVPIITFAPDRKKFLTFLDNTVKLWNTSTFKEIIKHEESINGVKHVHFSPDGKKVSFALRDRSLVIYDIYTGKKITTLKGHGKYVYKPGFSPDGRRIVTASDDITARIWDALSGNQIFTLEGHKDYVSSASFSPDGKKVITSSGDGTIRIWDAMTGEELFAFGGNGIKITAWGENTVHFSPDSQKVLVAVNDNTVRILDTATGKELQTLKGHKNGVKTALFSPDGREVATGSFDSTVRIWEVETGKQIHKLKSQFEKVDLVNFSPGGQMVSAVSWGETAAEIWDVRTGKKIVTLRGFDWIRRVFFSDDGKEVFSVGRNSVQIWDLFGEGEIITLKECYGEFTPVLSPDGQMVITGAPDEASALICDVSTGKELALLGRFEEYIGSASFSPDGQRVITASNDGTCVARIWETATGFLVVTLKGHVAEVCNAYFSPDGQKAVTCSWDGTARIWNASTGEEILILKGLETENLSAHFSPDGKRIVTSGKKAYWPGGSGQCSGGDIARIWDASTGDELLTLRGHNKGVWNAIFSPDGKKVLTASGDCSVRIWDASNGNELVRLKVDAYSNTQGIFSPDGQRVLTTPALGQPLPIWDSDTGKELMKLRGFDNDERVYIVNFSRDGKKVIAGSADGIVRIWDASTGAELATMKGHPDCIHWATFSPSGKEILIASGKTVEIWPSDFLSAAIRQKPRDFTQAERERYQLSTH